MSYHPQTHGLSERRNRDGGIALGDYIDDSCHDVPRVSVVPGLQRNFDNTRMLSNQSWSFVSIAHRTVAMQYLSPLYAPNDISQ